MQYAVGRANQYACLLTASCTQNSLTKHALSFFLATSSLRFFIDSNTMLPTLNSIDFYFWFWPAIWDSWALRQCSASVAWVLRMFLACSVAASTLSSVDLS